MAVPETGFAFPGGVSLRVRAVPAIQRILAAEYGWAVRGADEIPHPDVSLSFSRNVRAKRGPADVSGGYKSVRWRVRLSDPEVEEIGAGIALGGGPLQFGLSLVQGYVVEPLLSLAAPAHGQVLLPAAAIEVEGGAVVLMGRSRSGKSTVSARALAAGWRSLGDDQVLIDRGGGVAAFPRRMRLYSDLQQTAPDAYDALPARARRGLALRKGVRRLTRGYVAPPVRVPASAIGAGQPRTAMPIVETILIERSDTAERTARTPLDLDELESCAATLLAEQRAHVARASHWGERLAAVTALEALILRESLGRRPTCRVVLPSALSATEAISSLADVLGLAGPPPARRTDASRSPT